MTPDDAGRPRRVVVIGGGLTGLVVCHRLLRASAARNPPLEVWLIEASPGLGGVIGTEFADGFLMEKGPDCFLTSKPEAVRLCEELGLAGELIGTNPRHRRSLVLRGEKLLPVPRGYYLLAPSRIGPFLTTPVFSPLGKLRMAMDVLLPRRRSEADESLADFVRRRLGREALERMAQPMVAGVYSADPEKLSLKAAMPQFHEMEREHRSLILGLRKRMRAGGSDGEASTGEASGARYGLFAAPARGMGALADALEERVSGASVRLNCRAESLERRERGWVARLQDGEKMAADAVCLALPPRAAGRALEGVSPRLSRELGSIPSGSLATLSLGYRAEQVARPLDAMGFVVPAMENRTLLACSFSSAKFEGRAPEGGVLLRAFAGGGAGGSRLALTDEELTGRLIAELRPALGISGAPQTLRLHRWEASLPHYEVGHLEKVARIEKEADAAPGLALCGNAYRGVGIPDCARSAERAAEKILGDLRAFHSGGKGRE